jgi:DeoR/GlpR family transcriptional regulator of sugar metabolism
MAKRSTRRAVDERISLFWKLLYGDRGDRVGTSVDFETLATEANKLNNESQIQPRTCQHTLQQMQKMTCPHPGTSLIVGKDAARLDWTVQRVFDEREQQRPSTKTRLARLVWKILFNVPSGEDLKCALRASLDAQEDLNRRLSALRKKSPVAIFLDAGSTTMRCVDELLNLSSIPLHVPTAIGPDSEQAGAYRLVSPHITTNCPEIAVKISRSLYHEDIGVTIVGGDQRSQRGSICGSLAQLWMSHVNPYGDVSVIGSTGFRTDDQGRPAFGCDNHEEAELKASFLSRTWLRVVVMDSSKLKVPPVSRLFATLSKDNVHLVVMDDGKADGDYQGAVEEFCNVARKYNVPVALSLAESASAAKPKPRQHD